MPTEHVYRAYLLRRNGDIALRVDLDCDDDDAAKRQAKALADGYDVELWDGTRRIETFTTSEPSH